MRMTLETAKQATLRISPNRSLPAPGNSVAGSNQDHSQAASWQEAIPYAGGTIKSGGRGLGRDPIRGPPRSRKLHCSSREQWENAAGKNVMGHCRRIASRLHRVLERRFEIVGQVVSEVLAISDLRVVRWTA